MPEVIGWAEDSRRDGENRMKATGQETRNSVGLQITSTENSEPECVYGGRVLYNEMSTSVGA